jgi:hypothetical protein
MATDAKSAGKASVHAHDPKSEAPLRPTRTPRVLEGTEPEQASGGVDLRVFDLLYGKDLGEG